MDSQEVGGVIIRRSGSYGVSVYDRVLKRKRWVGTFATLKEAREAERQAATGSGVFGAESCAAFAERWLRDYPRAAAASRRTYGYALKAFIEDFGRTRLRDVDKPSARAWAH